MKMKKQVFLINLDSIKKLNPCKDRLDNYIKFYTNKEFTIKQFMGLKNITHSDKMWVAFRMMNRKQISLACADIAQSVLHIYESKYPNDMRVRECIEATKLYTNGKITIEELRQKRSAAAAYAAYSAAAYSAAADAAAAYSADAAAAYAAYSAAAYSAAADAAAAYAADAAAAYSAGTTRAIQEKNNRSIIIKYWKE